MPDPETHSAPQPPFPFPPPQTFDILPQIHDLITRLALSSTTTTATSTTSPIPLLSNNSNNPAQPSLPTNTTTPPPALEPKDLPLAALPIKHQIQRARAAVSALPDVERTLEEQEEEMAWLDGKIAALKRVVVAGLGGRTTAAEEGEVGGGRDMEGVEEGTSRNI